MLTSSVVSLLIIFAAVTVIPMLARVTRFPVIILEILLGVLIGKSFLNVIESSELLDFFSSFGLVYLLFIAGLEVSFTVITTKYRDALLVAGASLVVPFIAGYFVSSSIGSNPLLVGTIFSTSSLGVVIPLVKGQKLGRRFRDLLIASIAVVEVVSIVLLSVTIAVLSENTHGFGGYSIVVMLVLFSVPVFIRQRKIKDRIVQFMSRRTSFETGVRFSIALLLVLTAISGVLGFEAIIGAFLAGLIVRHLLLNSELREKLEGLGFGFFIPLFFVLVGVKIDIRSLLASIHDVQSVLYVIAAGLMSNIAGVFVAGKILRFSARSSLALGMFHATLLSLTIAAAEIASREGLIDDGQFAIFVLLAIVTTLIGATVGRLLLKQSITATRDVSQADQPF